MQALKNEFSWSASRHKMFKECPRKYYYNYYGSWGGWGPNCDRALRETFIQKKLLSAPMLIGDAVHRSVEGFLKELKSGRERPISSMLATYKGTINRVISDSESGAYKIRPSKHPALFEEYYRVPNFDMEPFAIRGEIAIKNFLRSKTLDSLRESDKDAWLPIEELQSFDFDGTQVFIKMDFAHWVGDSVHVYDWKTGRSEIEEDNIQLPLYASYAQKKWHAKAPIIATEKNLLTGKSFEAKITEEDIKAAEDKLKESITAMKSSLFDEKKNIARIEDFPKNEASHCKRCNFKGVCLGEVCKN